MRYLKNRASSPTTNNYSCQRSEDNNSNRILVIRGGGPACKSGKRTVIVLSAATIVLAIMPILVWIVAGIAGAFARDIGEGNHGPLWGTNYEPFILLPLVALFPLMPLITLVTGFLYPIGPYDEDISFEGMNLLVVQPILAFLHICTTFNLID